MADGESPQRFAEFIMQGKRFDAPGMPGKAAVEVAAYTQAIFSIARQLWLDANPDRSRVSPGVLEQFDLRLTGVDPGSARPVLQLHHDKGVAPDVVAEWTPHIVAARDQLTSAVRTLGSSGRAPKSFPKECLPDVARLGRSLLDGEKVRVGSPEAGKRAASYTHELKDVIRRIDEVLQPHERTVSVQGVIVEFDSTRTTFKLKPESGGEVTCRIDAYEERLVKLARDLCSLDGVVAPDVEVAGVTTSVDQTVTLLYGVSRISEVRSVWEKKVMSRLSLLRELRDGWNGHGSVTPPETSIQAIDALGSDLARLSHSIRIGATSSGAIAFEWASDQFEYTAQLLPDLRLVMHVDDLGSDDIAEYERPFNASTLLAFLDDGSVR